MWRGGVGWRGLGLVVAAVLSVVLLQRLVLVWRWSIQLSSVDPLVKSRTEFQVVSRFEEPVLYVSLEAKGEKNQTIARTALLGDGVHDRKKLLLRHRSTRIERTGEFINTYRLNMLLPSSISSDFKLTWRVEYTSMADSLRDFPVDSPSFLGTPSGAGRVQVDSSSSFGNSLRETGTLGHVITWALVNSEGRLNGWIPNDRGRCGLEVSKLDKPLTILGDSQVFYMCQRLRQVRKDLRVTCEQVKGVLTYGSVSDDYLKILRSPHATGIAVVNFSGLWETAYGKLAEFKASFEVLINALSDSSFEQVYFQTTTAVHPILYSGLSNDAKKWAMTMPRCSTLNAIAKKYIRSHLQGRVGIIDLERLSLLSDKDPAAPNDMRHFGVMTNDLLLDYVLCTLA